MLGLSTRQLRFISGISGFLFLGRLRDFAALRLGIDLLLAVVAVILFCWMIYDLMAARQNCPKPELRKNASRDVLTEFICLYAAIGVLVFLGGI